MAQITKKDYRTYEIIGAAMEVHKEMGCGFLEAVYQEVLGIEFCNKEIPFKAQPLEKKYQPDFICFNLY